MAINATTQDLQTYGADTVVIAGAFRPNGSSAVDDTLSIGDSTGKWSAARTDTGDFTITFDVTTMERPVVVGSISHPTDADLKIQWHLYDASAKTYTLTVLAVATPTDITSDADAWINFVAVFKNSRA